MNNEGINEIINTNNQFYEANNDSFDNSRSYGYWEGFDEILRFIPLEPEILDLGCGNGRFLRYLLDKNVAIQSYLGLDTSKDFLRKDVEKYPKFEFQELDVISNLETINQNFSLIVAFGLTHHIPNYQFRKRWFEKIEKLVASQGILALSFWEFDTSKNDSNFIPEKYLIEENDFFLGWKDNFTTHRYCHLFKNEEILEIISNFKNLELLNMVKKDQNTYLILRAK